MSLRLTNFRPVGLPISQDEILINDAGNISDDVGAARTIDCGGAYLSPGWADLHVHVWYGGSDFSIRAARVGVTHGVTAMADAGSAGEATFHGLREYVIDTQPETIRAFINIGTIGLVACNRVPELAVDNAIDVGRTLEVIEKNRDVICGIKVRIGEVVVGTHGIEPLLVAKELAVKTRLPLMVHIGAAPPTLSDIFDVLTSGDVVTHCFHGKTGSTISESPKIFDQAKHLAARGVHMDIGHGAASFDFAIARQAMKDGLQPYSISTDAHQNSIDGPVFDLATTASKLLALGLSFKDCVAGISTNPRNFLGINAAPGLGERADFTVFDLADCSAQVMDASGNTMTLNRMFRPRHAVLGNQVFKAASSIIDGIPA